MAAPSQGVRRFAAVTVYVLGLGWGVTAAIGRDDSPSQLVISFGLAVTCAMWCTADAAARGRALVWPARFGILLFWPVGVPLYLIWSRGMWGLITAGLAASGWMAVAFAAFMTAGYLTYGAAWFGRDQ